MRRRQSLLLSTTGLLFGLFAGIVWHAPAGMASAAQPSPTPGPTATPAGYQEPQVQGFAIQPAAPPPTDRGLDPADLIVNLFDSADLLNPVRTLRWEDPLAFSLQCFGETFPYEGCKLVPDLADGADWSVRWEGTLIVPADGDYTFTVPGHDDGVRVFIDGAEIVDSGWRYPSPDLRPPPQTVTLTAGRHEIVVDYEQRVPFAAELEVRWQGPGFAEEVLPIVADKVLASKPRIKAVEFTQAIQELQMLDALKQDLADDGEPPVPMVALKPAVARIYFAEVRTATPVTVRFRIPGVASRTVTAVLQKGCTVEQQRLRTNGCASVDIYFGPPQGDWVATLETFDKKGSLLEEHTFPVISRSVRPILFVPVTVCGRQTDADEYRCENGEKLWQFLPLVRALAPTHRVNALRKVDTLKVTDPLPDLPTRLDVTWWIVLARELNALWETDGDPDHYYFGMVHPDAPDTDNASGWGLNHGGAAVNYWLDETRPPPFQHFTARTIAEETGHMLGRPHTNTQEPEETCDFPALPIDVFWPYDDNLIQEAGFDVSHGAPLDPSRTHDIMAYCRKPEWVSPYTYRSMMNALARGNPSSAGPEVDGAFWQVSGAISDDVFLLSPVFLVEARGPTGPGSGDYQIQVQGASGEVLFTRYFTPIHSGPSGFVGEGSALVFSELIPFHPGAQRLVILDPAGSEIGAVDIVGAAPVVSVVPLPEDTPLRGEHQVEWSVSDPDSEAHTFRVEYLPDESRRIVLAWGTEETRMTVDFDALPSCTQDCRIRVLASDGANTGVDVLTGFRVGAKPPRAEILFPQDGSVFQAGQLVWLQAFSWDPDDGYLPDEGETWVSSLDGILGHGDELRVFDLSEGDHLITFTATDGDGNSVSDTVRVQVDGTRPELDLFVVRDAIPSRCVDVTISASDEPGGSGLATVEYSLDGGQTWTAVPPDQLPFRFIVPGTGRIDLVARAVDAAGNLNVSDIPFTIAEPCPGANRPPSAEAGGPYAAVEGAPATLDASASSDPEGRALRYEWDLDGDGLYDDAVGESVEVTFGDDGVFAVGLKVTDEAGLSDTDTAEVVVENLAPEVSLDPSGAVSFPGGEAFLGRRGVAQTHTATATDPGSDDLTFAWSTGQTATYFNDGQGPDPSPSPGGVYPFTVSDAVTVAFDRPGVYDLAVEVQDDDGGVGADGLPKVVTGDALCPRSRGFWRHQFGEKGKRQIDEERLKAYLEIVDFVSAYFQERVVLGTFEEAEAVLEARGPGKRGRAEAQVLVAWLNFAHGAVGWDEEILFEGDDDAGAMPFHQLMAEAEAILLDAEATDEALERTRDLAEAVNERDEEAPGCDEEDEDGDEDESNGDEEEQGEEQDMSGEKEAGTSVHPSVALPLRKRGGEVGLAGQALS